MQEPKHTEHNSEEVKVLLDKDKDYQDMQDEHDADWWHQLDLEIEQQLENEKIIEDILSSTCPRVQQ
jgi:phage pi2 protein 07